MAKKMDYARCSDVTDYSSLANCSEVCVQHIDLVWAIDFEASTIAGTATLTITAAVDNLTKIVLDTRDLAIASVKVSNFRLRTVKFVSGVGHFLVEASSLDIAAA
jgi:aminopeptidase N